MRATRCWQSSSSLRFLRRFAALATLTMASVSPVGMRPVAAQVEVAEATIRELQEAMESGRTTSAEITAAYLARIAAYDRGGPRLNSMLRLNPNALAEAEALDRERATGGIRGPLHGVPIALKDNYDTFDMPTSAGTLALASLVPPDDAFQVRKLREAGAVILGKTNMHELASGITTIASIGGQTPQSVRSDTEPRRLERGHRSSHRSELCRHRMGQRHVRINPYPIRAQQPRGAPTDQGALEHRRHRAALAHAGRGWAARTYPGGPCGRTRRDDRGGRGGSRHTRS